MLYNVLAVVYVLVCAFLIGVVLLQSGKGGGLGAAFGGGGSQTVFGGAGAGNFLTRLTAICAALFMVLSATLAYLSSGSEQSLERAAQDVAAREEARTGGGDEGANEPDAADMSVPGIEDEPEAAEASDEPAAAEADADADDGQAPDDGAPDTEPLPD